MQEREGLLQFNKRDCWPLKSRPVLSGRLFSKVIMKKRHAFTLIEVIFALTVISLSATYALQRYFVVLERVRAGGARELLIDIYGSQRRFYIQNAVYAGDAGDLDIVLRPDGLFHDAVIVGGANSFSAAVSRNSSNLSYTLSIDETASIDCIGAVPADICQKLGF